MEEKLKLLKEKLAEIADIRAASAVLGWDQLVNMPEGLPRTVESRSRRLKRSCIKNLPPMSWEDYLKTWQSMLKQLDPDSDDARLIKGCKTGF